MPQRKPPKYSLHKATGQARVRVAGKDVYLGRYKSPESWEKYGQVVNQFMAERVARSWADVTVANVALAYLDHAKGYYVKHGETTARIYAVKAGLRRPRRSASSTATSSRTTPTSGRSPMA
jgi:hypothetical protein